MAIEIRRIEDMREATIIGLEPNDRQPNDYLRMVARVFTAFKEVDPTKTVSTYISGFDCRVVTESDNIRFELKKGACFIDDQFIAFNDDIVIYQDKSLFLVDTIYYLVLEYQYTNQVPPATPQFKCVFESEIDESKMLTIQKFRTSGSGGYLTADPFPQDLDDKYMENFKKLFELVETKVYGGADQIKYDYEIQASELYVSNTHPELSTKSGDVVYLDHTDGLYKPARACNSKYDKAIGFYLFNNENHTHYIITTGVFTFEDKYDIDNSNMLLKNLEVGKTYYLLDNCSNTDYDFDASLNTMAGKISADYFPRIVRVGYAINNNTLAINFDYGTDFSVQNIMEILGIPEYIQPQLDTTIRYFLSVFNKDGLEGLRDEITVLKNSLIDDEYENSVAKDNIEAQRNNTLGVFQRTQFFDLYDADSGAIPVSSDSEAVRADITQKELNTAWKNTINSNTFNLSKSEFRRVSVVQLLKIINEFLANKNSINSALDGYKTTLDATDSVVGDDLHNTYYKYGGTRNPIQSNAFYLGPWSRWYVKNGTLYQYRDMYSAPEFDFMELPEYKYISTSDVDNYVKYVSGSDRAPTTDDLNATTLHAVPTHDHTLKGGYTAKSPHKITVTSYTLSQGDSHLPQIKYESGRSTIDSMHGYISFRLGYLKTYHDNLYTILNNLKNDLDRIRNGEAFNMTSITTSRDDLIDEINDNYIQRVLYKGDGYGDTHYNIKDSIAEALQWIHYQKLNDYNTSLATTYQPLYDNILSKIYYLDQLAKAVYKILNEELIPYLENYSTDNTITSSDTYNIEHYSDERYSYQVTKFNAYKSYSELEGLYQRHIMIDTILNNKITSLNDEISRLNDLIDDANSTLNELSDAQFEQEQKTPLHSIFNLNDYQRKIYNYTYITSRLRLKYKSKSAVETNIDVISRTIEELSSRTIPPTTLIEQLEESKVAYEAILASMIREITSLVEEYNRLRVEFGIPTIEVGDEEFSDYGLANPDLECFLDSK